MPIISFQNQNIKPCIRQLSEDSEPEDETKFSQSAEEEVFDRFDRYGKYQMPAALIFSLLYLIRLSSRYILVPALNFCPEVRTRSVEGGTSGSCQGIRRSRHPRCPAADEVASPWYRKATTTSRGKVRRRVSSARFRRVEIRRKRRRERAERRLLPWLPHTLP